jgi:hypothetical protein
LGSGRNDLNACATLHKIEAIAEIARRPEDKLAPHLDPGEEAHPLQFQEIRPRGFVYHPVTRHMTSEGVLGVWVPKGMSDHGELPVIQVRVL